MPFKEDLDRTPIQVPSDVYQYAALHSPVKTWTSIISATLSVPASAKTLAELLAADTTDVVDEVAAAGDGETLVFSGTLEPHPYMNIEDDTSVTFTATIDDAPVDITETGSGVLEGDGGNITGTIDYETGAWTLEFTTAPDDATNIVVDYTWFYVVPSSVIIQGLWMVPGAADEIYATYSEDGIPTATTGMLLSEAMFLAGQPTLIANAKFFGSDTALNVEVLI